ncbi:NUDIX domain-containing protein [Saccharococcus sp. Marseille-Q5394]|uniref:NUDIX domain-containing protein n=1 Tax=Saccharococcus sp. Marseille-Q5394 TaxID=2972778 RepID=UPI0021CA9906|nr:NUDIX hydrolase [Saccharococcus sp. Marseille-Q5394]
MANKKRGNVWLGAAGIVMNSKGEWLVVKKTYSGLKGMWSLPAGFVEGNETADQAAIREVREETGLDCKLEGMVGFRTGILKGEVSDNLALFLLRPEQENQLLTPQENEISEVAWKTPYELKDDPNVSAMIHEIAERAIESGLLQMEQMEPGEWFGYTSYKLFYKK